MSYHFALLPPLCTCSSHFCIGFPYLYKASFSILSICARFCHCCRNGSWKFARTFITLFLEKLAFFHIFWPLEWYLVHYKCVREKWERVSTRKGKAFLPVERDKEKSRNLWLWKFARIFVPLFFGKLAFFDFFWR